MQNADPAKQEPGTAVKQVQEEILPNHLQTITPQIVYKVAICPRGNLPYIQITSIVLPYSQSTNYLQ